MADEIVAARSGRLGIITLNRPQALNALSLEMCATMHRQLIDWVDDDSVEAVVVEGNGRAFCAGGDVVHLARVGRDDPHAWQQFFHHEYRLNQAIASYPKPYVSLLDGVAMGGGAGISMHGDYRVATENTRFAMPETAIGLVPDVGSSYSLPRFPGELGTWAALTAAQLPAGDCLTIGYATHFIPAAQLPILKERLAHSRESIGEVLATFDADPGPSALAELRDGIDYLFAQDQIEDILSLLDDGDDWARAQARIMRGLCPTSLKLALHALRVGEGASIEEALRLEYRMVMAMQKGEDFYEGVAARLIERNREPRWRPASLSGVDIAPYLHEPAGGDLSFE